MFDEPAIRFNSKAYRLTVAPTTEPVSLSDAKAFLKVDTSDEDALITALIGTARRMCEEFTKRAFITQTWELVMDVFSNYETAAEAEPSSIGRYFPPGITEGERAIRLSRQPIQSITKIESADSTNTFSDVSASVYTLDTDTGRILLNSGQVWPTNLRQYSGVRITYVAGYGNAAAVPSDIATAILLTVSSLYESRACGDMPEGAKAILLPYQLPEALGAW